MSSIDLQASIASVLEKRKKIFPQHVNRISSIDDPCIRRLYFARHDWDKKSPVDTGLQGVFETGNILEPVIERIVSEVGTAGKPKWRIVGTQTPTNDDMLKAHQISGTIDGFLQIENDGKFETAGVIDIKTMSPNIFARMHTLNDLDRFEWTKKYRGQVELYALAHNLETGYLLLVSKQNLYDMKLIEVPVDMDHCESLLRKADIVNEAIKTETLPDGINDAAVCGRCWFKSFCCPEYLTGEGVFVNDDSDMESIFDRLAELESVKKEIKALEQERDAKLVKGRDMVCGRFIVTWKEIHVHRKAQEAKDTTQWRKNIQAVD